MVQKFLYTKGLFILFFGFIFGHLHGSESETLFFNGPVYSGIPDSPLMSSVLIRGSKIICTGKKNECLKKSGKKVREFNLKGQFLMPGFQDAHMHVLEAGLNEDQCFFTRMGSLKKFISELQKCARQSGNVSWIQGAGVNINHVQSLTGSPRKLIDSVIGNKPVLILDDIGHGALANSEALKRAGYKDHQKDPGGGLLGREKDQGSLNGILWENAQQKVRDAAWISSSENNRYAESKLQSSLDYLSTLGITSVSDAGGYWTRDDERHWYALNRRHPLSVRASNALYVFPDQNKKDQTEQIVNRFSNQSGSFLRFNQVKIYVDGILSQGTSVLLEPYERGADLIQTSRNGFSYFSETDLNDYVQAFDKSGFQIHFHATGDKAVRMALDAVEKAQKKNGTRDRRHRITHLYLVHPQDIQRFKSLGVWADFQLAPETLDDAYRKELQPMIGERTKRLLPFNEFYRAGVNTIISSDWDAESASPFEKIQTLLESSKVAVKSRAKLIELMTRGVSRLLHQDHLTGTIEAGKQADLILLDKNLLTVPVSQISEVRVLGTMIAGEFIFD